MNFEVVLTNLNKKEPIIFWGRHEQTTERGKRRKYFVETDIYGAF